MLSIVIATKNRESILRQTLESYKQIPDLWELEYEIIIINDGEDFIELNASSIPGLKISIFKNKGSGAASARNYGANLSKGDIILFCDDDIIPTSNHFKRHVELHQIHHDIIVTANRSYPDNLVEIANKKTFGRYKLAFEYNWLNNLELKEFNKSNELLEAGTLASYSCSMKKSTFDAIGGFNESFPAAGCEDNEFCYRAKKMGFRLLFDKSNICFHNELDNFNLKNWLRRQTTGIKGAVISCSMYPEGKEHPTYYLNTPIMPTDSNQIKRIKRKRSLLANSIVHSCVLTSISILEFLKIKDRVIFKFYNAAWLGATKRSFMEQYRQLQP